LLGGGEMSTQAPTLRIDSAPSGTQFLIEHEGDTEYVMARLLEPKRMARIVTCVNSHEALIEALRELVGYRIEHWSPNRFGCDECRQIAGARAEIPHRKFCKVGRAEAALRQA